jgi:hypothetical protein
MDWMWAPSTGSEGPNIAWIPCSICLQAETVLILVIVLHKPYTKFILTLICICDVLFLLTLLENLFIHFYMLLFYIKKNNNIEII